MTNSSVFTEDSQVKISTILHLIQLGYEYLSLKDVKWDIETNIFPGIFRKATAGLNPEINSGEIDRALEELKHNMVTIGIKDSSFVIVSH